MKTQTQDMVRMLAMAMAASVAARKPVGRVGDRATVSGFQL